MGWKNLSLNQLYIRVLVGLSQECRIQGYHIDILLNVPVSARFTVQRMLIFQNAVFLPGHAVSSMQQETISLAMQAI